MRNLSARKMLWILPRGLPSRSSWAKKENAKLKNSKTIVKGVLRHNKCWTLNLKSRETYFFYVIFSSTFLPVTFTLVKTPHDSRILALLSLSSSENNPNLADYLYRMALLRD